MKNNNNNSKRDIGFSFDYSDNSATDTDQLLSEGSMARKNSMHGKENPSDASTALEALNNIFKAFNTVTEMGNCQAADAVSGNPAPMESGDDIKNNAVAPGDNNGAPESSGSISSPDNTPVDVMEKSYADNKEAESPVKQETEQKAETNLSTPETNKGSADISSNNLLTEIQRKLWFLPVFDGDERRVDDIRRVKSIVSSCKSYDSLLEAVNGYMNESNNNISAETFFLLHNIYSLDTPEKYYHFFRPNIFSKGYFSGGLGEEIEEILESILCRNKT